MQLCLLDAVQECVPFPQRSLGPQYVLTTGGAALFLESLLHIVLGEIPGRGGMKKGMCAAGFKLHSWCCAFLYASVCLLLMLVQSNRLVIQRISLYYKHVSGVSWSFHCRLFKNVCLFNSHVFGDPGSAGHTRPTTDWSHSQRYTHILVNSSSPEYCPIITPLFWTPDQAFSVITLSRFFLCLFPPVVVISLRTLSPFLHHVVSPSLVLRRPLTSLLLLGITANFSISHCRKSNNPWIKEKISFGMLHYFILKDSLCAKYKLIQIEAFSQWSRWFTVFNTEERLRDNQSEQR